MRRTSWKKVTFELLNVMMSVRNADQGPDPIELLQISAKGIPIKAKTEMIKYCKKKRREWHEQV